MLHRICRDHQNLASMKNGKIAILEADPTPGINVARNGKYPMRREISRFGVGESAQRTSGVFTVSMIVPTSDLTNNQTRCKQFMIIVAAIRIPAVVIKIVQTAT
jgi:hypothetical protein